MSQAGGGEVKAQAGGLARQEEGPASKGRPEKVGEGLVRVRKRGEFEKSLPGSTVRCQPDHQEASLRQDAGAYGGCQQRNFVTFIQQWGVEMKKVVCVSLPRLWTCPSLVVGPGNQKF